MPVNSANGSTTKRVFLKNSLANLISGLSTAALNLCLPPILSRYLPPAEFSAWTLILQLATYTALLNLGTQGAVSRFVAYYIARDNRQLTNEIASTAFLMLFLASAVGVLMIVIISENLNGLFPSLPALLQRPSASSLLITGCTLALGLPVGVFAGVFIGAQRNELVAAIQASTKLILGAALITVAITLKKMTAMAVAFCAVNFVGYFSYWLISRKLAIVEFSLLYVTRSALRELWSYCGTVMIWMLAMFLIIGTDTAIVGRVEFSAVGVYGACIAPMLLMSGIQQAVFGPLLQFAASHAANEPTKSMSALLLASTKLSTLLLLAFALPLLIFSRELVGWWLGPQYADQAAMIFRPLVFGNVVRLLATPYTLLLLATLKHRQVLITPLIEGVTNFVVAFAAGVKFGAVGVAYGVVVGAIVGQIMNYLINFPQTTELVGDRRHLLWKGVILPILCASPIVMVFVSERFEPQLGARAILIVAMLAAAGGLVWRQALTVDERHQVAVAVRRVKRAVFQPQLGV